MSDRIAAAFAGHGRRAALMPYLMGGHPDPQTSIAACEAAADAGADLIELGVPFSDPLADGPVIHAAATEAGYADHGAPGERSIYHPGYYGAFVLDPDGHNIEAVNHNRTTAS